MTKRSVKTGRCFRACQPRNCLIRILAIILFKSILWIVFQRVNDTPSSLQSNQLTYPSLPHSTNSNAAIHGEYILNSTTRIPLSSNDSFVFITNIASFIGYHFTLKLIAMNIRVLGMDNFNGSPSNYAMKLDRIRSLKKQPNSHLIADVLFGNISDSEYLSFILNHYAITHILHFDDFDDFNHFDSSNLKTSIWHYLEDKTKALITLSECVIEQNALNQNQSDLHKHNISIIYAMNRVNEFFVNSRSETDSFNLNLIKMYRKEYGLRITLLRFVDTAIFGPFGSPHLFSFNLTRTLFANDTRTVTVPFAEDTILKLLPISDAINSIIEVMEYGHSFPALSVRTSNGITINDLIHKIQSQMQSKFGLISTEITIEFGDDLYDLYLSGIDPEEFIQIRSEIDLEDGIHRFVDWFLEKGHFMNSMERKKDLILNVMMNPLTLPQVNGSWNHHQKIEFDLNTVIKKYYHSLKQTFGQKTSNWTMEEAVDLIIFENDISWNQQISNPQYHDIIFIDISWHYKHRHFRAYNDARFIWWHSYLCRFAKMYRFALITDLFDVQFGRNPFDFMERVIGENESLVITGKEDDGPNTQSQWRKYLYSTMIQCYGATVWRGTKMMESQFMYNPGSGIGGHAKTVNLILGRMVNHEMDYVEDVMCDANMVQFAKSVHTLNEHGIITVLDVPEWNSPFKAYENWTDHKYVVYHK